VTGDTVTSFTARGGRPRGRGNGWPESTAADSFIVGVSGILAALLVSGPRRMNPVALVQHAPALGAILRLILHPVDGGWVRVPESENSSEFSLLLSLGLRRS